MLSLLARAQGFLWLVGCIAVIGFGFWMVAMLFPKRTDAVPDQFDLDSKPDQEVRPEDGASRPLLGYTLHRTETDRQQHTKRGEN